jgi:ParB family chromosome partitioning protein
VARRAADEDWSVRETAAQVQRYQALVAGARSSAGSSRRLPAEAAEAQRALSDGLQTRVRVEMGTRKGRIVVDFVSLEELERLQAVMLAGAPQAAARVTPD